MKRRSAVDSAVTKIALALIGPCVAFVVLEIGLRVFSFGTAETTAGIESRAVESDKREGELRIVTIGESTTAPTDIAGVRVDWPFQLKKKFEVDPIFSKSFDRIRVFNLGTPATTTPFLLTTFLNQIDRIDPDVVVAMMGVNDNIPMALTPNAFYKRSRALRFLLWAFEYRNCSECFDGTWPEPREKEDRRLYTVDPASREFAIAIGQMNVDSTESYEKFQKFKVSYLDRHKIDPVLASAAVASRLLEIMIDTRNAGKKDLIRRVSEDANAHAKIALKIGHKDTTVIHTFCHLSAIANRRDCSTVILDAMKKGMRPSYSVLSIGINYGGHEDPQFLGMMKELGFEMHPESNALREVSGAYRRLADLANERHYLFMAMQYPGGTRDGLAAYFNEEIAIQFTSLSLAYHFRSDRSPLGLPSKYRNVVLVDNEKFRDLVNAEDASEYFTDFFARHSGMNFGHATEKGNGLIADNVAATVRENIGRIEDFHRRRRSTR